MPTSTSQPSFITRNARLMFYLGLPLVIIPTAVRTYLLLPFPGSMDLDLIGVAFYADKVFPYLQIIGALLMLPHLLRRLRTGKVVMRILFGFLALVLIAFNYMIGTRANASSMFHEMGTKAFTKAAQNKIGLDQLVIGVEHDGVAKAYPVWLMVYHHRLADTVGKLPVLVTYCSMCRTGRVYDPFVDGAYANFRLVGAQHYSAVLEDDVTGTWWYQAGGTGGYGKLEGTELKEIPSEQTTLRRWIERHPETLILQPDPNPALKEWYEWASEYGTERDSDRDSTGKVERWRDEAWVVGTSIGKAARAYGWNDLLHARVINDSAASTPVVVAIERDTLTFHTWKSTVGGERLAFMPDSTGRGLRDRATGSLWDWTGRCIEGAHAGGQLEPVYARQQYWHSWKHFNPGTTQWEPA